MKKTGFSQSGSCWLWLLFVVIATASGCENAPSTRLPLLPSSENYVVQRPYLANDWIFAKGEFLIQRQSPFQFTQRADRDLIERSLQRIDAMPKFVSAKPAGIADEDYAWLRRFLEPPKELQWISIGNRKVDLSQDAFCIANDGTKMVTAGKQIAIWDCSTGTSLSQMPSPILNPKHVLVDNNMEHLFVSNSEEIVKSQINNNETTNRWRPSKGQVVSVVKSRDVDTLAVLTSEGDLVALNSDLKKQSALKLDRSYNSNVAISANGEWVTASTQGGVLRWNIETPGQAPTITTVYDMSLENALVTSGTRIDRWIHRHKVFVLFDGKPPAQQPLTTQYPLLLGNIVSQVHSATVDGSQDWLVTIGVRGDEAGKKNLQIQDWDLGTFTSSTPQKIDRVSILAASFDRTGEHVALKSERGIEVLTRNRWIDSDGAMTRNRLVGLFTSGEFDRLEKCADELRKLGKRKFNITGAEHWDDLARAIGLNWADLLIRDPDEVRFKQVEVWANKKSELALLSSITCAKNIENYRRFPGGKGLQMEMYDRVIELNERYNSVCQKNLETLLASSDPTPASFGYSLLLHEKSPATLIKECDKILQACIERWPECVIPHRFMMELLINTDGLNSSECYPYLNLLPQIPAASKRRPNGFVPSCLSSRIGDNWFVLRNGPLSVAHQKYLVEGIFSDDPIQPWKFEPWMFLGATSMFVRDRGVLQATQIGLAMEDLMTRMIQYHQKHYELPLEYFYNYSNAPKLYSEWMDTIDP